MKHLYFLALFFLFGGGILSAQTPEVLRDFMDRKESVMVWKDVPVEKLPSDALRVLPSGRYLRFLWEEARTFSRIEIQDLMGQTVLSSNYDLSRDLDISTLKEGGYIVKVTLNSRVLVGKFIIPRS